MVSLFNLFNQERTSTNPKLSMFPEPKPLVPSGPLNLLPSDEESFLCLNHFVFNQIKPEKILKVCFFHNQNAK